MPSVLDHLHKPRSPAYSAADVNAPGQQGEPARPPGRSCRFARLTLRGPLCPHCTDTSAGVTMREDGPCRELCHWLNFSENLPEFQLSICPEVLCAGFWKRVLEAGSQGPSVGRPVTTLLRQLQGEEDGKVQPDEITDVLCLLCYPGKRPDSIIPTLFCFQNKASVSKTYLVNFP